MTQIPSNLIPTRVTQLPEPGAPSADGYLLYVYQGKTYKVRAGDLLLGTVPDGSITTAKLASGAVTTSKLDSSAVTSSKIATGQVLTDNLADLAVTTAKMSDSAVTNAKIGSNAVTTSKIATGAVGTDQLAAGAVTRSILASSSVDSTALAQSAVTNSNIAPNAVSADKLSQSLESVGFNTTTGIPAFSEGKLFYDKATRSLAYFNDDSGVTVNLGREQLVRVYNPSASVFLNGAMVYISGAVGGWPTITLAQANSAVSSQSTLGMVTANIAAGAYGYVCVSGVVNDIDTSAYAAGTTLYLSAGSAGGLTSTRPLQPNYVVEVATVLDSNSVTGKVLIRVDNKNWFPNVELRETTASVTLPTAPAVFKPSTTAVAHGFTYDSASGVLTVLNSGSYSITIQFNALPSASNKNVYFYVEESTDGGSSWGIVRYSGRELQLPNSAETQVNVTASRYYATGTKLRYYIWGDATVTLKTSDLTGTTPGTVTKPAYRFTMA